MEEIRPLTRGPLAIGRNPFRGLVASCDLAVDKTLPSYEPLMRALTCGKQALTARL